MAIEVLNGPLNSTDPRAAGPFSLPAKFDIRNHSAKWVKKGNDVEAAGQREHLAGTRASADGWQVWRDGDTPAKGSPFTTKISSGEYVLLFRPKAIQDAVNAIYGNVGKERMITEKRGETSGGIPINKPGQLGDEQLARVIGRDDLTEEGEIVLNKVHDVRRIESPPLELST